MAAANYVMYLNGQHDVILSLPLVFAITHVCLAFILSHHFNDIHQNPDRTWPLFTTVERVRSKFPSTTKVLISIGGWGDVEGFEIAAATESTRRIFARNVWAMVTSTGADGVDIGWEYPGGNSDDYKTHPNADKAWQIAAYPKLLAEIRRELGTHKIISAAVPGLPRDMMAFTKETIPDILKSVEWVKVMTYDLMNSRDNVTKHHAGIAGSLEAIDEYEAKGVPPHRMNLGFAFYIKYFGTAKDAECLQNPVGCKIVLMEDPRTGADLGQCGAFAWHEDPPAEVRKSFERAMTEGKYDDSEGGHYYWDEAENLWWTWETPAAIQRKLNTILQKRKLRGAFAWALGEDANDFVHLKALNAGMKRLITVDDGTTTQEFKKPELFNEDYRHEL